MSDTMTTLHLMPDYYLSLLRQDGHNWTTGYLRPMGSRPPTGYLPLRYLATPSTAWADYLNNGRA